MRIGHVSLHTHDISCGPGSQGFRAVCENAIEWVSRSPLLWVLSYILTKSDTLTGPGLIFIVATQCLGFCRRMNQVTKVMLLFRCFMVICPSGEVFIPTYIV